jgi:pre-mRNA-processing factor 6
MCCVAGLFAADRKTDKARAWFERCVTAAPDVGDFWARYVAFEAHLGAEAAAAAVAKRCCAAQPRHGEFWARVAKRPENAHESIEKLLAKVVTSIEQETPP